MIAWNSIRLLLVIVLMTSSSAFCAGFIDTPDSCYVPDRTGKDEVHLRKVGVCSGSPGRAFIDSEMSEVNVVIDGALWKKVKIQPLAIADISGILNKGAQMEWQIVVPENKWAAAMEEKAVQTNNLYMSEAYQANLKKETERLRREIIGDRFTPETSSEDKKKAGAKGRLLSDERVYLFVSSSMPLQTVRNYIESVSRLGDPNIMVVMRGFIGGLSKIAPTFRYVNSALKEDPSCNETREECALRNAAISVDPLLFRRYGIDRVPAVVYAQGVSMLDDKMSEGNRDNTKIKDFYRIYGDASLEYLLERIQRDSSSTSLPISR